MLQFAALHDRHLVGDPGEGDVGLRAAKFLERGRGEIAKSRHAGGGSEHPVRADKVAALTDRFARQPHRLFVVPPDELSVGSDAGKERREWIARAQTKRAAGGPVSLLAAAAIGQCKTIKALRQREI